MKITESVLDTVAVKPEQYPRTNLPEIALAGRSNVGKSSFINKMINRRSLARTSQKPGKTQTLNFYKINDQFYFVDVPGYGFAQVSKKERDRWGAMIETYLYSREQLQAVLLIIDIRHAPTENDVMMYNWLKHFDMPTIIVGTKCDKVSRGKRKKHIERAAKKLQKEPSDPLIAFSAETGEGKEELWDCLRAIIYK